MPSFALPSDFSLSPQLAIAGILLLIGLAAIIASFVTGDGNDDDSGTDQGPDDDPDRR
jgi:hypothetical protein